MTIVESYRSLVEVAKRRTPVQTLPADWLQAGKFYVFEEQTDGTFRALSMPGDAEFDTFEAAERARRRVFNKTHGEIVGVGEVLKGGQVKLGRRVIPASKIAKE